MYESATGASVVAADAAGAPEASSATTIAAAVAAPRATARRLVGEAPERTVAFGRVRAPSRRYGPAGPPVKGRKTDHVRRLWRLSLHCVNFCDGSVTRPAGTAGSGGTVLGMDLVAALSDHFGFPAFRPGQREACEAALAGRDVLVVMPTGSGKSLCYQLPALVRDDLTIVVSPLVALMQDQVDALRARGLADRVALVNAQQDGAANAEALARAVGGELRLLYVAPERFSSPGFVQGIADARVGLFVVDEAHCVSQWGHDFRPDYFRLADAARYLGASAIVASTATATPQVARDIEARLGLRDPVRVTTGFDRPNLDFAVVPCKSAAAKHRRIAAALGEPGA